MTTQKVFALVAGETSGDILGSELITALKQSYKDAKFVGIGGPKMQALGLECLGDFETLNVLGFWEPLKRLPTILKLRHQLFRYFQENPPTVFIGIDAAEFNLGLEAMVKTIGNIPIVHYASPQVWAWRQSRVKKIAKIVDLMLVLFPFEEDFYLNHNVNAKFVGHPLADAIPFQLSPQMARKKLNLPLKVKTVAMLPGSRKMELAKLGPLFLQTAKQVNAKSSERITWLAPMVNVARQQELTAMWQKICPEVGLHLIVGDSRTVLAAADAVLTVSGTATLETMLVKRPMLVVNKVFPLTYWVLKKMVKVPYIGLPNLIASRALVPEFIQHEATISNLSAALMQMLNNKQQNKETIEEFEKIHHKLQQQASTKAAAAIAELV